MPVSAGISLSGILLDVLEAIAPLAIRVVTVTILLQKLLLEVLVLLERGLQVLLECLLVKLVELDRQRHDFMHEVLNERVSDLVSLCKLKKVLQVGKLHFLGQEFLVLFGQLLAEGLREERHGEAWLLLQQVVAQVFCKGIEFVELGDRESLVKGGGHPARSCRTAAEPSSISVNVVLHDGIVSFSQPFEKGVAFDLENFTFIIIVILNKHIGHIYGITHLFALGPVKLAFEAVDF